jgi:hypothetical protein
MKYLVMKSDGDFQNYLEKLVSSFQFYQYRSPNTQRWGNRKDKLGVGGPHRLHVHAHYTRQ